jgi:CheY-like chemotaxis protein
MSELESPQEKQTINQLSAQFVHDIATPLVTIRMLAEMLETYLPTTLSAYQQAITQGEQVNEIPPDQYQALESAATRIKALAQQVNNAAKDYWQQIDLHTGSPADDNPVADHSHAISLGSTLRILVAEDDDIHQKIALKLLSGLHTVDIAKNGHEAVEYCRKRSYDLVLMDLNMPIMDGLQAVTEIMQLPLRPQLIIGLTNRPLGAERKQLLQQGFGGFIEKPLRVDELECLIMQLSSDDSQTERKN